MTQQISQSGEMEVAEVVRKGEGSSSDSSGGGSGGGDKCSDGSLSY